MRPYQKAGHNIAENKRLLQCFGYYSEYSCRDQYQCKILYKISFFSHNQLILLRKITR